MSKCPLKPAVEAIQKIKMLKGINKYTLAEILINQIQNYLSDMFGTVIDFASGIADIGMAAFSAIYNAVMTAVSPSQWLCYSAYEQVKKIKENLSKESSRINQILSLLYRMDAINRKKGDDQYGRMSKALHGWLVNAHKEISKFVSSSDVNDFDRSYRNLLMADALLRQTRNKQKVNKIMNSLTTMAVDKAKGDPIKFDDLKKTTQSVIDSFTDISEFLTFIDTWIIFIDSFSRIIYASTGSASIRDIGDNMVADLHELKRRIVDSPNGEYSLKKILNKLNGFEPKRIWSAIERAQINVDSLYGANIIRVGAETLLGPMIELLSNTKKETIAEIVDADSLGKKLQDDDVYKKIYDDTDGYSDKGMDVNNRQLIKNFTDKLNLQLGVQQLALAYKVGSSTTIMDMRTQEAVNDFAERMKTLRSELVEFHYSTISEIYPNATANRDMTVYEFETSVTTSISAILLAMAAKIAVGSILLGAISFSDEIELFSIYKTIVNRKRQIYSNIRYQDERLNEVMDNLEELGLDNFIDNIKDGAMVFQDAMTDASAVVGGVMAITSGLSGLVSGCLIDELAPACKGKMRDAIEEVTEFMDKIVKEARKKLISIISFRIGIDFTVIYDYLQNKQRELREKMKFEGNEENEAEGTGSVFSCSAEVDNYE